jgi:tellurite resistance protein TerC
VGQKFFVRQPVVEAGEAAPAPGAVVSDPAANSGKWRWAVTPLFLVLLVVETTDVAFAVDSIPAIFVITRDPFVVFTSNVFAILGLRALYFLLAGAMGLFRYLNTGLAAILCFVGVKMLIAHWYVIPIGISLGIVAAVLALSVAASLVVAKLQSGQVVTVPIAEKKEPGVETLRG